MAEAKKLAPLAYLRQQVALPGENFVAQWSKLTPTDKEQMLAWARSEMDELGI